MDNALNFAVKVSFTWKHVQEFRDIINRANRRRFNKLSRMGRLLDSDVPVYFLVHTQQGPFAEKTT